MNRISSCSDASIHNLLSGLPIHYGISPSLPPALGRIYSGVKATSEAYTALLRSPNENADCTDVNIVSAFPSVSLSTLCQCDVPHLILGDSLFSSSSFSVHPRLSVPRSAFSLKFSVREIRIDLGRRGADRHQRRTRALRRAQLPRAPRQGGADFE